MNAKLVVLDTNVVLDLFMFDDPGVAALAAGLQDGSLQWLATAAMRDELARVLAYPNIVAWSARRGRDPQQAASHALANFDCHARLVQPASVGSIACSDPDDQGFIDLAAAHGAALISKDRAVQDAWRRFGHARQPV